MSEKTLRQDTVSVRPQPLKRKSRGRHMSAFSRTVTAYVSLNPDNRGILAQTLLLLLLLGVVLLSLYDLLLLLTRHLLSLLSLPPLFSSLSFKSCLLTLVLSLFRFGLPPSAVLLSSSSQLFLQTGGS